MLNLVDILLFGDGSPGKLLVLASQWTKNPLSECYYVPVIVCGDHTSDDSQGMVTVSLHNDPTYALVNCIGFGKPTRTMLMHCVTGVKLYDGRIF